MKLRRRIVLLLLVAATFLFYGCGDRPTAYGVLLWTPEDAPFSNGRLLQIFEESRLNNTYTVSTPEIEERVTLAAWRVERFEEQEAAMEYASGFAPYAQTFARAGRQALPVRVERDRLSADVYRLRENELMKVLRRAEEPSNEAGFEGYWYYVLTREGVRGWAFGHFLNILENGDEVEAPSAENGDERNDIELILSNSWRPEYFLDMINDNRVDISRMRPSYGLFPDRENQEIRIVLPEHTVSYPYEEFFRAGPSRYGLEGSPVTITLRGSRTISVQYTLNGREQSGVFVLLNREISEIVEDELARRDELWERFIQEGNTLVSTAYGRIELMEERRFRWNNYDRLTPTVIPSVAGEAGTIEFSLFLSDDLRQEYDGAVLFSFEGEQGAVEVRFTYEYTETGIRLTYVPPEDVTDNTVQREAFSPIVIFFSYENS